MLLALQASGAPAAHAGHEVRTIEGWTVQINERLLKDEKEKTAKALELLTLQLQEIIRVVPKSAVTELQKITLWFSPEYSNAHPRAEYHPGAEWLRENGRDPIMVKGVEFTDVRNFEAETRRMPNFTLHELAHGYHDQVVRMGFGNLEVKAAYAKAKASGKYDRVERQDSEGRKRIDRAYAMTNPQEYFAESTESFFSRNDFFPFNHTELEQHDPEMLHLLERLWNVTPTSAGLPLVTTPPAELKLPAFYTKYISANGYPIVSSEKVNDYALREAAYIVNLMLAKRPDVRTAMIKSGSRLAVIAHNEYTTDLPGWEHLKPKDFWDARARGLGGSQTDPLCSCAEENMLAFPGDPYEKENILIHEFAHNIHLRGMVNVDPTFDDRVKKTYEAAMTAGLWKGKYASVNHHEYFAEGVQSWFDNNRKNDADHNHVNTRALLLEYDPGLAALCREVFGDTELKYTKPATRLRDHLAGYDPSTAPTFTWPERLIKVRAEIKQKAQARSDAAQSPTKTEAKPAGKAADYVGTLAASLEATNQIVYKRVADRELHLHLFQPQGWKSTDKRSCFVIIHGGGWTGMEPRRMYPFAAHFSKLGMVGISVQYRLANAKSGVSVFDCVMDARSALRYVRAHAAELGIDPQKIIASGGSAGGHLAAATALFDHVNEETDDMKISPMPNALVLLFPVIDTSTEGYGNKLIGAEWQTISPLHQVHAGVPPTITFHGTGDTTTPFKGAKAFHEAMLKAGNRSELVINEGGVHGYLMRTQELYEETMKKTEEFLSSLKLLSK